VRDLRLPAYFAIISNKAHFACLAGEHNLLPAAQMQLLELSSCRKISIHTSGTRPSTPPLPCRNNCICFANKHLRNSRQRKPDYADMDLAGLLLIKKSLAIFGGSSIIFGLLNLKMKVEI
jgi:hypothetical protein